MTAEALRAKLVTVLISPLIKLLFAAAMLVFVWGLVEFLWKLSNGSDTKLGKDHMLWGIIGLVVMTAAYAIINMVLGTFNINTFG